MKVPSQHRAVLFYSMAVLTACTAQGRTNVAPAPASPLDVITDVAVANLNVATAYEVVERARPMYLMSSIDLAPTAERQVYYNGIRVGGVGELRRIPANEIKEIRFVRAIDGAAYGIGSSGGAILVISKSGRR